MHGFASALVILSSVLLAADGKAESSTPADGNSLSAAAQEAQPHSIIYLSDQGAIVIEMRVLIGDRPLEQAWEQYVDALYKSLDADQSGELSVAEAAALPAYNLLQQAGLVASNGAAPRGAAPDSRPRDGRVTRDELADYLERVGGGAFTVSIPQRTEPNRARGALVRRQAPPFDLIKRLDRNDDGRLSADEFAFDVQLLKNDRDDDRTLSQGELAPFANPYAPAMAMRSAPVGESATFLAAGGAGLQDVRLLLERYDGNPARPTEGASAAKDNTLSAAELGLTPKSFAATDADGSGGLDFDELRRWLKQPPADVRALVRIDTAGEAARVEFTTGDLAQEGRIEQKDASSKGAAALAVGEARLEFAGGRMANLKQRFTSEFESADGDGNGYIDMQESRRFFAFGRLFTLLDADQDEKVFKKEAEAWAERWAPAFGSRVVLTVADQGRKLFEILDVNRDGRLGETELSAGAKRIADWDADGDGALSEREVPSTWSVSVDPVAVARADLVPARSGAPVQRLEAAGPDWLRRMDRNGDGLVSRREFLGPLADFARLDADADGYLTAEEAD